MPPDGCCDAAATASGPVRPSSAAQPWMCGQSRWPWCRSALPATSARIIAVMAVLRSRTWPGSQDTSHPFRLGACRAVWAVWSLVMVVSLMVRVMVRLPGRVPVRGGGSGRRAGHRSGRPRRPGTGLGASRWQRRRSRSRGACGWVGCRRAGGSLACLPVCRRGGLRVASGRGGGGLGGLDQLSAQVVICLGVPETRFAGRTGLAGAVGAEFGAVAFVVGGYIQGDQQVLDLADRDEDGVLSDRGERLRFRPRRYLADAGAERVVQGAFVDVRQVADENNGPGSVLVVAAGVPMPVQHVEHLGDHAQVHPVPGHAPFL